jgi:hypothetical protein
MDYSKTIQLRMLGNGKKWLWPSWKLISTFVWTEGGKTWKISVGIVSDSSEIRNDYLMSIPLLSHECPTIISRVSYDYLECPTIISRVSRDYLTSIPRLSHECPTIISWVSYDYLTSVPRLPHEYPTTISRVWISSVTHMPSRLIGTGVVVL